MHALDNSLRSRDLGMPRSTTSLGHDLWFLWASGLWESLGRLPSAYNFHFTDVSMDLKEIYICGQAGVVLKMKYSALLLLSQLYSILVSVREFGG